MIVEKNGIKAFGLFKGLPYGQHCIQDHRDYLNYHNSLSREVIEAHIRTLVIAHSPIGNARDTVMEIDLKETGAYDDGPFRFPIDFLRYYTTYGIGIPPEYEKYLIETVGLR